jgi:hypothetical protein
MTSVTWSAQRASRRSVYWSYARGWICYAAKLVGVALGAVLFALCLLWNASAQAAEPEPSPSPSPTSTPEPTPSPTPVALGSDSVSEVVLTDEQYEVLKFGAASLIFLTAATFVTTWRRA